MSEGPRADHETTADTRAPEPMYAWMVFDVDERWGTIAAMLLKAAAPIALVTRERAVAERWRPLAEAHRRASGRPVRLFRFERVAVEAAL